MDRIIHHIHRVRRQPEEVRQTILHVLTISFGVILFLLWVLSIGSGPSSSDSSQALENDLAPFSALKANLTDGFNSISGEANTDTEIQGGLELDTTY